MAKSVREIEAAMNCCKASYRNNNSWIAMNVKNNE